MTICLALVGDTFLLEHVLIVLSAIPENYGGVLESELLLGKMAADEMGKFTIHWPLEPPRCKGTLCHRIMCWP